MDVVETTLTPVAAGPPDPKTTVAPVLNPVPVIVARVPPAVGPDVGDIELMVGGVVVGVDGDEGEPPLLPLLLPPSLQPIVAASEMTAAPTEVSLNGLDLVDSGGEGMIRTMALALCLAAPLSTSAQTLDEIVAKHLDGDSNPFAAEQALVHDHETQRASPHRSTDQPRRNRVGLRRSVALGVVLFARLGPEVARQSRA